MKDAGGGSGQHTAIDVFAGLRWWYQELGLSLEVPIIGRQFAKSGSVDWIDPLIGMRIRNQIAPGKSLNFRGDIGGFGVNSDFSWQLAAIYQHEFGVRNGVTWSGVLGYRAISVDYSEGNFAYDINQHGPVIGLSAKW